MIGLTGQEPEWCLCSQRNENKQEQDMQVDLFHVTFLVVPGKAAEHKAEQISLAPSLPSAEALGVEAASCPAVPLQENPTLSWRARVGAVEAQGLVSFAPSLRRRRLLAWSAVPALRRLHRMRILTLLFPRPLPSQASRGLGLVVDLPD